MSTLQSLIAESAYHDYVYAYPHKSAWRPLDQAQPLEQVWANENLQQLFGYIHIPFCEMRCGFCNLFTNVDIRKDSQQRFIDTLKRQIRVYRNHVADFNFSSFAIGGGTPSVLDEPLLDDLLNICINDCGVNFHDVSCSIEVSPATVNALKIKMLHSSGIERISIGVQSFDDNECRALRRPQDADMRTRALQLIQKASFPTFNIDLIYGIPGQTAESFLESIKLAIAAGANELYLYPLYIRQLTLLGIHGEKVSERLQLYKHARNYLLEIGWNQKSMRCFKSPTHIQQNGDYRCQRDGMIGFGVGARSYTKELHYSSDYAVRASTIKDITNHWCNLSDDELALVDHGFVLSNDEQKRRYLILSLLDSDLSDGDYHENFLSTPLDDFPCLNELISEQFVFYSNGKWVLSESGLALSDSIGHWLFSPHVNELMTEYQAQ